MTNVLGTIQATGAVILNAGANVENLSGTIQGQDVTVNAQTIENITLVSRDGQLILPADVTKALSGGGSEQSTGQSTGTAADAASPKTKR